MSQSVIVMGMVLTAMPVNDYDKRITILTKERGKITAFARGSRRPSSQLLAATNPFAFGEFEVFEGRNSYNVTKANIQNYFRELVLDLDAASLAFYFAEFAEYYCQENNDEREMLKLLYQSFRALENSRYSKELVRAVFELKAITINGEGLPGVCLYALSCERRPVFLFGEKEASSAEPVRRKYRACIFPIPRDIRCSISYPHLSPDYTRLPFQRKY